MIDYLPTPLFTKEGFDYFDTGWPVWNLDVKPAYTVTLHNAAAFSHGGLITNPMVYIADSGTEFLCSCLDFDPSKDCIHLKGVASYIDEMSYVMDHEEGVTDWMAERQSELAQAFPGTFGPKAGMDQHEYMERRTVITEWTFGPTKAQRDAERAQAAATGYPDVTVGRDYGRAGSPFWASAVRFTASTGGHTYLAAAILSVITANMELTRKANEGNLLVDIAEVGRVWISMDQLMKQKDAVQRYHQPDLLASHCLVHGDMVWLGNVFGIYDLHDDCFGLLGQDGITDLDMVAPRCATVYWRNERVPF